MRLLPSRFLVFSAFNLVFASEIQYDANINEVSSNERPHAIAHRRSAITSRNSSPAAVEGVNNSANNEFPTNSFGEYETRGVHSVEFTEIPLQSSKLKAPVNSKSSGSAASLLFSPVDKQMPNCSDDYGSENEDESIKKDDFEQLLSMIPEHFIVTETSGTYGIDVSDAYLTSAEIMKKRSALYTILAEVYTMFDMFDFDGFMDFLRKGKVALKHRDFPYHLVENIVQRSMKTKNEGTLESLARFIEMIDSVSVKRTVGGKVIEGFKDFKKKMEKSKISKLLSETIKIALSNYFVNEKTRLDPLKESLTAADYTTAKNLIETSEGLIFISPNDFIRILGLSCSSARYNFISWAISGSHFNPFERYDSELMTPLMFSAMWPTRSNDIVKAILLNAPATQNLENSKGMIALDFAKKNNTLPKIFRKPLIEMLELENPSLDSINEILNKYITKSK